MSKPAVWDDANLANPHAERDKAARVQTMFASIAGRYDLNNRLHSFGQDQRWRKAVVKWAEPQPGDVVADIACGTGDLTLAFAKAQQTLGSANAIGIDFTFAMLPHAHRKQTERNIDGVRWACGDAMNLPLPDASADVVSIAFGIRNVSDVDRAMREFYRVLRPGGRLMILEFSEPFNPVLRTLNNLYTQRIMPTTATLLSGDKTGAYKYLPRSVDTFIGRGEMVRKMEAAGFESVERKSMTFGVVTLYRGHVAVAEAPMTKSE